MTEYDKLFYDSLDYVKLVLFSRTNAQRHFKHSVWSGHVLKDAV